VSFGRRCSRQPRTSRPFSISFSRLIAGWNEVAG
jgi:hypothetical protein